MKKQILILIVITTIFLSCEGYKKSKLSTNDIIGKWELVKSSTGQRRNTFREGNIIVFENNKLFDSYFGNVGLKYKFIDSLIEIDDTLIFEGDSIKSKHYGMLYFNENCTGINEAEELKPFNVGKIQYFKKDTMVIFYQGLFLESKDIYVRRD